MAGYLLILIPAPLMASRVAEGRGGMHGSESTAAKHNWVYIMLLQLPWLR